MLRFLKKKEIIRFAKHLFVWSVLVTVLVLGSYFLYGNVTTLFPSHYGFSLLLRAFLARAVSAWVGVFPWVFLILEFLIMLPGSSGFGSLEEPASPNDSMIAFDSPSSSRNSTSTEEFLTATESSGTSEDGDNPWLSEEHLAAFKELVVTKVEEVVEKLEDAHGYTVSSIDEKEIFHAFGLDFPWITNNESKDLLEDLVRLAKDPLPKADEVERSSTLDKIHNLVEKYVRREP